jgi:hypothetical protein
VNTGIGDPINYSVPIATILGYSNVTWTGGNLSYPGIWSFGVRAFNPYGIELNLDIQVTIILDSNGNDITNRPLAPLGLRAIPTISGGIRVEWMPAITMAAPMLPTGFHVYAGIGSPNYTTPVATVAYTPYFANIFTANLSGLMSSTTYSIVVRAYNSVAEEPNTNVVTAITVAAGPSQVQSLSGSATSG